MSIASLRAVHREIMRALLTDPSPRGFTMWWRSKAKAGQSNREIGEQAFAGAYEIVQRRNQAQQGDAQMYGNPSGYLAGFEAGREAAKSEAESNWADALASGALRAGIICFVFQVAMAIGAAKGAQTCTATKVDKPVEQMTLRVR